MCLKTSGKKGKIKKKGDRNKQRKSKIIKISHFYFLDMKKK